MHYVFIYLVNLMEGGLHYLSEAFLITSEGEYL